MLEQFQTGTQFCTWKTSHALHEKTIFSIFDLIRTNNQIPVNPEDVQDSNINIFRTIRVQTYPFGWNAVQTFQRFINEVLHGLEYCYAYIDDILIASANEQEHKEHLQIFTRLDTYGIRINPEMHRGEANKIPGIRRIFRRNETADGESIGLSIQNFPRPKIMKQLQHDSWESLTSTGGSSQGLQKNKPHWLTR